MRRRAQQGRKKVRQTFRNRSVRIGLGLAIMFAFGLMASGAFGDSVALFSASTDTTMTATYSPTVTTDQQDYSPGSVVTITGAGWPAGDSVTVFTNDTIGNSWSQTDQVTADSSGGFTDQVTLPTN